MFRYVLIILIGALVLVACAGTTPVQPAAETETRPSLTPTESVPTPYPEPSIIQPLPSTSPYPDPSNSSHNPPTIPPSGYEPQPGDDAMQENPVFLELGMSRLHFEAGSPVPVSVLMSGNLPSPCHELRVVVLPPDLEGRFNLKVYTLVEAGSVCITVLEPFEATIPLGNYSSGNYSVYLNDEFLDVFGVGYQPQAGDENMIREQAFLDIENSTFFSSDTKPIQVSAILRGSLPDPCHQLRVVVNEVDEENVINLDVYSLVKSGVRCITVIKPYQAIIPLGSFDQGHYIIKVNGELLGEFDG